MNNIFNTNLSPDVLFLITRTLGLIALSLNLYGFYCTNSKKSKLFFCYSSVAWALQSLSLGATSGALVVVITGFRQGISAFIEQQGRAIKVTLSIIFTFLAIGSFILSNELPDYFRAATLFPLAATITGTWSAFILPNKEMRYSLYLVNLLWLGYAISVSSWELMFTGIVACFINYKCIKKIKKNESYNPINN